MSETLDQARAVRAEDGFDIAKVDGWLKAHIGGLDGTPVLAQFAGGASNLTYLLTYPGRELVLRQAPPGASVKSAHDMTREARVMAALKPHYPLVPEILAICDDASVLGQSFYAMERLRGTILRRDIPKALGLDADATRRLCLGFWDRLVDLHRIDARTPALQHLGKGEGYIERQVLGWSERWQRAAVEDTDPATDVLAWLAQHRPARDNAVRVIHNDYRFDNVVLALDDPQRIVGVLDWEMATLGDPLMDLGGSLAYWVQADDDTVFRALRRQPSDAEGMLTRAEIIDYYASKTGLDVSGFAFYEVFGLFRLAVIAQQIYRRYALGHTRNPQFAGFGDGVRHLIERCRRISGLSAS